MLAIRFLALLGLPLLANSCQMYRSNFDCPPCEGIPCTSVTNIESMVIETNKGADVVAGSQTGAWKRLIPASISDQVRCVWISTVDDEDGNFCRLGGQYIYLVPSEKS